MLFRLTSTATVDNVFELHDILGRGAMYAFGIPFPEGNNPAGDSLPALDVRYRCSGPRPVLKKGVLDPFPLLLEDGAESGKRTGSFDLVNPLLLVTETKGMAYSLHYAAFPLDAFHTDGEIFEDLFHFHH